MHSPMLVAWEATMGRSLFRDQRFRHFGVRDLNYLVGLPATVGVSKSTNRALTGHACSGISQMTAMSMTHHGRCEGSWSGASLMRSESESDDCNGCDQEYCQPEVCGPFRACSVRVYVYIRQLMSCPFKSNFVDFGAMNLKYIGATAGGGSGTPLFGQHSSEACRQTHHKATFQVG
jgi:hypothetical protein